MELIAKLKESQAGPAPQTTFDTGSPAVMQSPNRHALQHKGSGAQAKIIVSGSTTGTTHTINEEERREFTKHINRSYLEMPILVTSCPSQQTLSNYLMNVGMV